MLVVNKDKIGYISARSFCLAVWLTLYYTWRKHMTKDRSGRRVYRKSPGRQYGYDYNPLRGQSRGGARQNGRSQASAPGGGQATYEEAQRTESTPPGGTVGLGRGTPPSP